MARELFVVPRADGCLRTRNSGRCRRKIVTELLLALLSIAVLTEIYFVRGYFVEAWGSSPGSPFSGFQTQTITEQCLESEKESRI